SDPGRRPRRGARAERTAAVISGAGTSPRGKVRRKTAGEPRCHEARRPVASAHVRQRDEQQGAEMTLHPKHHKDLMLAPVAAEIDLNLQRIRDGASRDVLARLELELDRPAMCTARADRADLVLRQALRG